MWLDSQSAILDSAQAWWALQALFLFYQMRGGLAGEALI